MPQPQVTEAQIAEAAFFIWQAEGQPEGQNQAHWFRAIEALKAQPAAKPKKKATAKAAAPKAAAAKAAPKAKADKKPRAKKAVAN